MTEEEYWLSTAPNDLVLGDPLSRLLSDVASCRKSRLFTCGCCRAVEKLLTEQEVQTVALAERYAEGQVGEIERAAHLWSLVTALDGTVVESTQQGLPRGYTIPYWPRSLLPLLTLVTHEDYLIDNQTGRPIVGFQDSQTDASKRARLVANWTATILAYERQEATRRFLSRVRETVLRCASRVIDGYWPLGVSIDGSYFRQPRLHQLALVRDIFGNPFRPVTLDRAWLTSDVTALAKGIYDDRAFDRMPILADALQDAGCDNDDILNHCRGTSLTHVRGCWVIDLMLGKQ